MFIVEKVYSCLCLYEKHLYFEKHFEYIHSMYLRGVCRSREECGGFWPLTVHVLLQTEPAPQPCTHSLAGVRLQ